MFKQIAGTTHMNMRIRMASGLFGLGIAMTLGMGPGIANAESVGGHESATVIRAGKVAVVATKSTKKTGTAMGILRRNGLVISKILISADTEPGAKYRVKRIKISGS